MAMQHMWGFLCPSISVSVQRRHPTHTSIFSVWAHHTDSARPSLAAILRAHQFQAGLAHWLAPAWSVTTVLSDYIQRVTDSNRHHLRLSSSSQLVIRRIWLSTVGEHTWWPVAASGAVCHLTTPQLQHSVFGNRLKIHLFIDRFLPNAFRFLVLYNVCSGLAVLYLSHSI